MLVSIAFEGWESLGPLDMYMLASFMYILPSLSKWHYGLYILYLIGKPELFALIGYF